MGSSRAASRAAGRRTPGARRPERSRRARCRRPGHRRPPRASRPSRSPVDPTPLWREHDHVHSGPAGQELGPDKGALGDMKVVGMCRLGDNGVRPGAQVIGSQRSRRRSGQARSWSRWRTTSRHPRRGGPSTRRRDRSRTRHAIRRPEDRPRRPGSWAGTGFRPADRRPRSGSRQRGREVRPTRSSAQPRSGHPRRGTWRSAVHRRRLIAPGLGA